MEPILVPDHFNYRLLSWCGHPVVHQDLLAQYLLNQKVLAIMLEQHPLNHLAYGNHAGKTLAESASIWQPFLHNAC